MNLDFFNYTVQLKQFKIILILWSKHVLLHIYKTPPAAKQFFFAVLLVNTTTKFPLTKTIIETHIIIQKYHSEIVYEKRSIYLFFNNSEEIERYHLSIFIIGKVLFFLSSIVSCDNTLEITRSMVRSKEITRSIALQEVCTSIILLQIRNLCWILYFLQNKNRSENFVEFVTFFCL